MKIFIKHRLTIAFIITLGFFNAAHAASEQELMSVPHVKNAQQGQTIQLVKTYFEALNKKDMNLYFSIIDKNVIHDINQGTSEQGIEKFKEFMKKAGDSFDEKLSNLVIMVSDDGKYAAARWLDHGTYIKDFVGMDIPAKNQKYTLSGGHFFEIQHGKITRVTTYYNIADFMEQVKR